MGNLNAHPPVVVVHKGPRKNSKVILEVFNNIRPDDIINGNKRKPYVPKENEILEIGWGNSFVEKYQKKYKLK
jgi:hypothetical protein